MPGLLLGLKRVVKEPLMPPERYDRTLARLDWRAHGLDPLRCRQCNLRGLCHVQFVAGHCRVQPQAGTVVLRNGMIWFRVFVQRKRRRRSIGAQRRNVQLRIGRFCIRRTQYSPTPTRDQHHGTKSLLEESRITARRSRDAYSYLPIVSKAPRLGRPPTFRKPLGPFNIVIKPGSISKSRKHLKFAKPLFVIIMIVLWQNYNKRYLASSQGPQ